MKFFFYICLATYLFTLPSAHSLAKAEDLFVYRNARNDQSLDLELARKVFMTNTLSWEQGKTILVIIKELDQIDEDRLKSFANLTKVQFLNRWRIKFFSGRSLMPKQVKSDAEAFEILRSNPHGIYFSFSEISVDKEEDKNSLKVDKIIF